MLIDGVPQIVSSISRHIVASIYEVIPSWSYEIEIKFFAKLATESREFLSTLA